MEEKEKFEWDWRTGHRSVSQLKEYSPEHGGCPYRWYLHRVARDDEGNRLWEKPAAWSPQGSAVHEAAEAWEKSGRTMTLEQAQQVFLESYAKHINRLAEQTPNFRMWFRSGGFRRTVEEDIERRCNLGLEQVERYIDYYTARPDEKPIRVTSEEGEQVLAVELPFQLDLDGVKVIGFIDQVVTRTGAPIVRDLKTGKAPGDDMQLAVYKQAMGEQHGVDIEFGDYWMAVSGKPTFEYDLSEWPRDRLADEFGEMDQAVKAEKFDPNPSEQACKLCSYNWACPFKATDNF